jgi:hypothetical protein
MTDTTQSERAQRSPRERLFRPRFASEGPSWLWPVALAAIVIGLVGWAVVAITGSILMGLLAMWCFSIAGVALAFVLPLPYALVVPLYAGIAGWLVDMLPLVVLVVWLAVLVRWGLGLFRERRLPRGGRWIWLPIALVVWTSLGVLVISSLDLKHFALLLGIQVLASGTILLIVDTLGDLEDRIRVAAGLVAFVVTLSAGVFLQWIGVPIQPMQDSVTKVRVEAAYGLDAFPNITGMIKYARSRNAGNTELRKELNEIREAEPGLPEYVTFIPKFKAFRNQLVVRFAGSARAFEDQLASKRVTLIYDNLGVAPGNTVPRMRSFPRNALTYAGACAAIFPLAFFLVWTQTGRRRILGYAGIVSCLFGSGFSLARGSWIAIAIGAVYLLVDGTITPRQKLQVVGAVLAGAIVLTGVFSIKYGSDPISARAGGEESFGTRQSLYADTVQSVNGVHYIIGFGTERPRKDSTTGARTSFGKYVPAAGTHSTYLNYLFRTGVPGALGIFALYLIAGLHARAAARSRTGDERVFATSVAAAVVILGAHAVILNLFVEPVYTLGISALVGLAVAGSTGLPRSIIPWRRVSEA